jgi:glycerol-3-phosphate acyltransferase PlsY
MIAALVLGYLIGSIPSADAVGRLRGHDLRHSGSGNPGTANALRVGGPSTAAFVLVLDLLKGAAAAATGWALAGEAGAAGAALTAVAGQIRNPWFGFRGGKGLGVAVGATMVVWPLGVLIVIPVAAVGAWSLRSAGGALLGLAAYLGGSILWAANDWPRGWGIHPDDTLVWLAIGLVVLATPKFAADIGRPPQEPLTARSRRRHR